ncbi:hypothetical protein AGMMS49938_04700 [Fibrobacterales bacterium]|nr:hypothetical protein AGMMS49938_04700 [Fibrobacterales bacterium]
MFQKITLLLLCLLGLAFSQFVDRASGEMEQNRIRRVLVEGNVYTEPASVISRISIKENSSYPPATLSELVRKSIESVYETGLFDDVQVSAEYVEDSDPAMQANPDPNAMDIIFTVAEHPALDTLIIEGNDEMTEDDLRLKTRIIAGEVYSKSSLERDRQAILAHYRSEGYLLAQVGISEIPAAEHKSKVIFSISEGNKVKVDSILVNGNVGIPSEEILEKMLTKTDSWWGGGDFKRDIFETDRDSVLFTARHYGYLDAELIDYSANYLPDSSTKFYLGRMTAKGQSLQVLYAQTNKAIANESNPLHKLAGKSIALSSHYYREHRAQMGDKQAFPVPTIYDEKQLADILNNIVTYGELRKEWIKSLPKTANKNSKIDSLLALKKRSPYAEKLLVRYSLEETLPALAKYDSTNTASYVRINIDLKEGRKYYAGNVSFTGNEVLPDAFLKAQVRLDSGKVFDYYAYSETKKSVTSAYSEDGYLFVQLDETKTFTQDSIVNLNFDIREGLPAQIHKVHIRGNTKTKDKVIRREIKLYPGETFRQSLLERSFRDIMQLNYFDNVVPNIQPVGEQDIDLQFAVSEREAGTGQFGAGAAYSQADGLVFTLSLSIPNCCMGDGQSANVNAEYGVDKRSISLGFSEPWFLDRPITLGFSTNYTWYNGESYAYNYDIRRYGASVYAGTRLKWPDDYFYIQGGYSWQRNEQGNNTDGSLVKFTGLESSLNLTIRRDDKNMPIFPTDGSRYTASFNWATPYLGSDFSFLQTDLSIKWWFPLYSDKLALGITNEFGIITGSSLQYRSLYQMGGALGYSGLLRGYSSGSIGAYRLGRAYQYFGAELSVPLAPNRFYLLPLFFDAGNVFGKQYSTSQKVSKDIGSPLRDWDIASLKRDFGFGFRVIVPMLGIIGFDFAWPLDPGEVGGYDAPSVGTMEFNFIIGQGF